MDPRAGDGAEAGQPVGGDVDRAAPAGGDARVRESGEELTQTLVRARLRRQIVEHACANPAPGLQPPGAASHQDAAVGRRPEVVEEHAAVRDRLAARPADLLEQLRDRLRQDDSTAERRLPPADRPARRPRVQREHDFGRADGSGRCIEPSGLDRGHGRVLVELDVGIPSGPLQRQREPRRLHRRAVAKEDAAAEAGRVEPVPGAGGDRLFLDS